MFHKITHLLVILVCLALVIPALNCAPQPQLELKLEKAPRLNEPVKLTCIRKTSDFVKPGQEKKASDNVSDKKGVSDNVSSKKAVSDENTYDPAYEKIVLEFDRLDLKTGFFTRNIPLQEVLVGNSFNWEGHMTGEPMEFSATIKLPYEGCWSICARSTQDWLDSDCVFVQVTEDESMFGCQKDYRPNTSPGPDPPTKYYPITVELDIPKPPRLNEPVELTWSLNSIRDVDGVIGRVEFVHLEGKTRAIVPAEDMLIKGDLNWTGSLKKDSPLYFSATVKFPQEGDWVIRAHGDSFAEQHPINSEYPLFLHIDKNKSRWGWTESHEIKTHGPPPPVDEP